MFQSSGARLVRLISLTSARPGLEVQLLPRRVQVVRVWTSLSSSVRPEILIGRKISSIGRKKEKKHLHREGNSRVTNPHEGLMDDLR